MIEIMLAGFPASASGLTKHSPEAYWMAVEQFPLKPIMDACRYFLRPGVRAFAPSAQELAHVVEMMTPREPDPDDPSDMRNLTSYPQGQPVPAGKVAAGMLMLDYGHGRIDVSRMEPSEIDAVMKSGGRTGDGKRQIPMPTMRKIG